MTDIKKHWLLNLAHLYSVRLDHLFPEFKSMTLNVVPFPNYDSLQLSSDLIELLLNEEIAVSGEWQRSCPQEEAVYEIQQFGLGSNTRHFSFKLTQKGGVEWERLARPKWERFIKCEDAFDSDNLLTNSCLASSQSTLIVAYLGWYRPLRGFALMPETIEWQTKTEYPITYWKLLNRVEQATFRCAIEEGRTSDAYHYPIWLRNWWREQSKWHTKPWQRSEWEWERDDS